ncbi:MAG: hypoxanthine phosphoribosyltransferase [Candidatus Eremiobacteraeota bacterium]|nr:hypoxanthine phosphoribosyltransferase [Candidatus Eremiobacteraeota bacterium]
MNVPDSYDGAIEKMLFSAEDISQAVRRLAREIASDHCGQPLTLIGVLKGALYATTDLARAIAGLPNGPSEIIVDYICVSSYGNRSRSSGEVRMLKDASEQITGRAVVIVEDIVDNGLTLSYLQALLRERNPESLRSCVLFNKPYNRRVDVTVEYVGLQSPDEFVVGYGLDYQEVFRNLPYLAQLRPAVFKES